MLPFHGKIDFGEILLASDADGTLLTDDKRILDIDKAAIREFRALGGLFTIATGRGVTYARPIADELELDIPAVIFNGAAVYDFRRNEFLWRCALPDRAIEHIMHFVERFPSVGVEILRGDEVYVVKSSAREEEHVTYGGMNPVRCAIDDVPRDGWIKTLLADEAHVIDGVTDFAKCLKINDLHMVRSGPYYFEILPYGVNKGGALEKLIEISGFDGRYLVAVGDFMNDLEMLRMADVKIAVSNAEEVVKAEAELIVCDNNSGAISEIVEFLKKGLLQKLSLM